ncbi:MAG: PIG-L family deacetylase [Chitinophagaceae bacterium]|nr:PIG-L family deacetylase [Chitinophagaceae bacterium]
MKNVNRFLLLLLVCLGSVNARAQLSAPVPSSEILQQLKKLKVLGSVLYVAAHPDDENTRLIAWLANYAQYRTGYLSLTRGDGGQNLIGDEQGVELGLIRTQELLAARRIDGGEQFFSRAYDFGFSKSPEETFNKWDKEAVLADVVWVIRQFQPDVIIARFPEDSRAGHGHHSASGILARLGYEMAGKADQFPQQLRAGVSVWQPRRVLWNTFNFGGGSNTIDSTVQLAVEVGQYMPLLGRSIGELAGESRSQHKSQGFGVSRQRGNSKEYFSLVKGEPARTSLMDGVNTTWSRVPGADRVPLIIDSIIAAFSVENPAASVPGLRRLRQALDELRGNSKWVDIKLKETDKLLAACAGLYAEAVVTQPQVVAGDTLPVMLNIINRSATNGRLLLAGPAGAAQKLERALPPNQLLQVPVNFKIEEGLMRTQPYWLRLPKSDGMFDVGSQREIGVAENEPLTIDVLVSVDTIPMALRVPVQYRRVDPVKAELYNPVHITNPYLLYNDPGVLLFRKNSKDSAVLQVNVMSVKKSNAANPTIALKSSANGYKAELQQPAMQLNAGDKKTLQIKVPNYLAGKKLEEDVLNISFRPATNSEEFFNARRMIEYDHIPTQTWHYQDVVKVLHIDLQTTGKKIGYLPGAGDKIPEALLQMGYEVTVLNEAALKAEQLARYDAVITGVRAYNIHDYLGSAYEELMRYVNNGGNLIVQYVTNNFISSIRGRIAPYAFNVGRTRITDENAAPKFLLPDHPVLNVPNKITAKDFEGWVQERSIYHAEGTSAEQWQMPLGFADPGETMQNGALAIAPYGKGNFVYTGLVFFRQLPAGVPGAYRLLANLIALPKR